jgi:hypothetical protein
VTPRRYVFEPRVASRITPVKLETGCYPYNNGRHSSRAKMKEAKPEGHTMRLFSGIEKARI